MRIALDAMGGDRAPEVVVRGAFEVARSTGLEVILVGVEDALRPLLAGAPESVSYRQAPQVVAMDEPPSTALRRKPESSIAIGVQLVKSGEAGAFVSAGNTGAVLATALFTLGRSPGVERPALAVPFPTDRGVSLLLDAGANADVRPSHLVQFAHLGVTYAKDVLGIPSPRVALLNIGEEPGKGNQLAKEAFDLLTASDVDFAGNLEGKDLGRGLAEVIVTDGFTGNVAIKVAEGVAENLVSSLRTAILSRWRYRLAAAVLRPAFRAIARRLDYSEYGGAPLLGVQGTVIIAHGRSDERAIGNAILAAARAAQAGVREGVP